MTEPHSSKWLEPLGYSFNQSDLMRRSYGKGGKPLYWAMPRYLVLSADAEPGASPEPSRLFQRLSNNAAALLPVVGACIFPPRAHDGVSLHFTPRPVRLSYRWLSTLGGPVKDGVADGLQELEREQLLALMKLRLVDNDSPKKALHITASRRLYGQWSGRSERPFLRVPNALVWSGLWAALTPSARKLYLAILAVAPVADPEAYERASGKTTREQAESVPRLTKAEWATFCGWGAAHSGRVSAAIRELTGMGVSPAFLPDGAALVRSWDKGRLIPAPFETVAQARVPDALRRESRVTRSLRRALMTEGRKQWLLSELARAA